MIQIPAEKPKCVVLRAPSIFTPVSAGEHYNNFLCSSSKDINKDIV